ncbi:MAG: LLM class F420-dependent oxidoreductase [Gammaproteobacteria bacterium]|nr:LLM class F420-dependent oxidoreductase [Gammaproteobacteria bacterium]
MKFGLIPINIGIDSMEQMIGLAQLAERVGWESVWTFEHVIIPLEYQSKYPYSADGRMAAAPDMVLIDPLIALTAVAAATKTIRLGTGVNILSQTNPLYMAKQAASLDMLSDGRFMLGVGIGWLREEFDALGVPFERRGARFDDYVVAMKKVWSGEVVEHESDFLSWHGFKSYPVPAQKPHLPIIMGGNKGKIYQRIARHGDGWFAPTADPAELRTALADIAAACTDAGRDPSEIEITCMWPGQGGKDAVARLAEVGVHRLVVPLFALGGDPAAGLQRLADEVI